MNRNDWIGMATSLALHALLLVAFAFMMAAAPEPQPLGFIEVEMGPFTSGRPVQRADVDAPSPAPRQPAQQQQTTQARPEPPREARPVRLPKAPADTPDPERLRQSETEQISPETRDNPATGQPSEPKEETPVQPLGSGARDGTTGAADGDQGAGTDATKAAPFLIEGLNRDVLAAPAPAYREKVNATIVFNVVVNPAGQIVSAFPVRKANATLERAITDALRRWRFNRLPANAPQVNQTGTVTFRFRLE